MFILSRDPGLSHPGSDMNTYQPMGRILGSCKIDTIFDGTNLRNAHFNIYICDPLDMTTNQNQKHRKLLKLSNENVRYWSASALVITKWLLNSYLHSVSRFGNLRENLTCKLGQSSKLYVSVYCYLLPWRAAARQFAVIVARSSWFFITCSGAPDIEDILWR